MRSLGIARFPPAKVRLVDIATEVLVNDRVATRRSGQSALALQRATVVEVLPPDADEGTGGPLRRVKVTEVFGSHSASECVGGWVRTLSSQGIP